MIINIKTNRTIEEIENTLSNQILEKYPRRYSENRCAFLLSSGAKGKRIALPNSEIMIHQPLISGGLSGQCTDIKIASDHLVRVRKKMNEILAENTGKPLEVIERDTERDNYMYAPEAKEYGLIDKVIAHR